MMKSLFAVAVLSLVSSVAPAESRVVRTEQINCRTSAADQARGRKPTIQLVLTFQLVKYGNETGGTVSEHLEDARMTVNGRSVTPVCDVNLSGDPGYGEFLPDAGDTALVICTNEASRVRIDYFRMGGEPSAAVTNLDKGSISYLYCDN